MNDTKQIFPQPKIKTIRLNKADYAKFRKKVFLKYKGRCVGCGKHAPLFAYGKYFDPYICGHVSHIKSKGSGGNDTMDNVQWHCFNCHRDWEDRRGRYKDR